MKLSSLFFLALTSAVTTPLLRAQTLPPDFSDQLVVGGWSDAVGAVWDGNNRMYVWEKRGMVWIVENGVRLPDPLIDLREEVGNWRDHGLLGFALDPAFLSNGHIYLFYTVDRHHLMHHGTPSYDPIADHFYEATIMRITRYTAIAPGFLSVSPASRHILLGETAQTGAPVLHDSHSTGSLVFGTDGTLMATIGDAASFMSADVGSAGESYFAQALADGIIRDEENVGALRSQMINSLNGKIIRIHPASGDGIASNPWYDPEKPRAPSSRVWGMGLRNSYRMTLKPNSGSIDPSAGQPGHFFFGEVGWNFWEELNICTEAGMNFGWPLFEGLGPMSDYMEVPVANRDVPNPLYNGTSCSQEFLNFQDLLVQSTPIHLNAHPNPCDSSVQIPMSTTRHFHARPVIDWRHGNQSRCGAFDGATAITFDLVDPNSPVPGPQFGGFAAIGGPWMEAATFPAEYQNSSFHADFAMGWIKRFVTDESGVPISVHDFAAGLGNVTWMHEGPDGCIWYIRYNTGQIRKICYTLDVDLPPVALAEQNIQYGPTPLQVQFTGSNSVDPENGQLTYFWDFGNEQTSTLPDPSQIFIAPAGVPTTFNVTLTVTDPGGQQSSDSLIVSVNNTPPVVEIISFEDGSFYPIGVDTLYQLQADVSDAEHGPAQLTYAWRTVFHHNTHSHPESIDEQPITSTMISGVGCDGQTYSYTIVLTVTDAGGLSTTVSNALYPRCHAITPIAIISSTNTVGAAPWNVLFNGTSSYAPGGSITNYHWDFGDGTFSTSETPAKTFTENGDHLVVLTVTGSNGLTGQATRTISVITLDPPLCVGAAGSIMREQWNAISGDQVSDLTSHPGFPNSPTSITYPANFQGPTNAGENFGARLRGYIIAPVTGNYIFTVTGDDAAEVYLSANAETQHKTLICSAPSWTGPAEFDKFPSQSSSPKFLVAGTYYYVEALHKEGSGGDHLALYWQTPANNTHTIIPGSALARWQDCLPSVRLRVRLHGPYNATLNLMRDDLRAQGIIPLNEPYTGLGFTHVGGGGGEVVAASRLDITGKNAVVDWVFIELRNANDHTQIVATKSALVERDGDVIAITGHRRLLFNVPPGEYHIAIRHRNHFGVMSGSSFQLGPNEIALDLTLANTATYGINALRVLPNGSRALWSGEAHRDGLIKYTGSSNDRDKILQHIGGVVPTGVSLGYHVTDLNLDGIIRYTGGSNDRDVILQNIGGVVPTYVRVEQLP